MQKSNSKIDTAINKWRKFFKILIFINVATILIPQAILLAVYVQSLLKPASGYEFIILGLSPVMTPLFCIGIVVALLNAVSLVVYLIRKKPKLPTVVFSISIAIISLAYFVYTVSQFYSSAKVMYESERTLSRKEAVRLVDMCQAGDITLNSSSIQMTPREGFTDQTFKDWYYREVEAGSFNELRAAAYKAYSKCGKVNFLIVSDPQPTVIDPERAETLLKDCNVLAFTYYSSDSFMLNVGRNYSGIIGLNLTSSFTTNPTSLFVPPDLTERLLPVAKEAQNRCFDLTISRDGEIPG